MEDITLLQMKDFAIVALAILAFIVLVGNAIKTLKNWKKPHDDEINGNSNEKLVFSQKEITDYLIER